MTMNLTETTHRTEATSPGAARKITIQDVTGSRRWAVTPQPHHETVGDLLSDFVSQSQQATADSSGRQVTYTLRGDDRGGGVRLHPSQPISDLEDGDELTLSPSVQAG